MADENNWTQWAMATAAFGAGAAYEARGRVGQILNEIRNPYISPSMTADQNIAQRIIQNVVKERGDVESLTAMQRRHSLRRLSKLEQKLNKQSKIPGMSDAIVREWEEAKRAVLPTGLEVGGIHAADPFAGVRKAIERSDSVYTQNVFRRFASNVETLSQTGNFKQLGVIADDVGIPKQLLATPLRSAPSKLKPYLQELQSIFGEGLEVSRRGVAGSGELIFTLPGSKKSLFTIPESFGPEGMQRGLVRTGAGLHNIYAPGMFSTISESGELGAPISFSEFKMQQIVKAAKEALTGNQSEITAIKNKSEQLNKLMDFMEPSLGMDQFSLETIAKSQRLTVVDETGAVVKGIVAQNILKRNPNLTPTSATGRFQTLDPSQLYGGFSESIDYARKPWQWIKQYRPTAEAQKAIMESEYGTKQFDFLDSPMAIKQFNGPSGPRLKTLYLSDEQINTLSRLGFPVGDGELLLNERFKTQSEVTRTRRVALKEITDTFSTHMLATQRAGGMPDVQNMLLGRTTTGELFAGKAGEVVREISPTIIRGPGGIKEAGYNVVLEETIKMGEYEKSFGGLKGMGRSMNFDDLADALASVTPYHPDEIRAFGAIGRFSDIKASKDPALRAMQQFSALVNEAADATNPIERELMQNPSSVLARINKSGDVFKSLQDIGSQMGIVKNTRIFEEIFGEDSVYGITRLGFGGTKEFTGAGKVGTVEPRILNLLYGRGGEFGSELGEDLMGRVVMGAPDKMSIHNQLRETFASMAPGAKTPMGVDLRDVKGAALSKLRREGGYIQTGIPDMPNIYMPGYEGIPALAPYKVGEDMVETAPIKKTFRQIEKTAKAALSGEIGAEEAMAAFTDDGYLSQLYKEFAPGGKGMGSLARGEIFGSRFLTAVSGKSEFYNQVAKLGLQDAPVIGIPRGMGLEMIEELASYGFDTEDMLARFERGEAIGGAVARHPFIGAYSMQPVQMIATEAKKPVMYVPEKTITARIKGVEGTVDLTEGILQGMALDKDADIAMAIAVNQEMEERIRTQMATPGSAMMQERQLYAEHAARMKLLKAPKGAASAGLSRSEQIAAAGTKLGIIDDYVGRVSAELSRARAAVVSSNLDKSSQLRALGLLEWLEQQPISGKHLTAEKVLNESFQNQMEAIISGVAGDEKLLVNTVREMATGEVAEKILGKGVQFEASTPVSFLGQKIESVPGFELETTARQISDAVRGFQTERMGDLTRSQVEKYIRPGQMALHSRDQIPAALAASDMTKKVAQSALKEKQKMVLSAINRVGAEITGRVRPLAKPVMMGLAAAGATAFAFSGPPEMMEAPADTVGRMPPQQAVIGRSNRDEISIPEPSRQILGEPSTPQPFSNRAVMLDENQANRSRDMRMRISAQNLSPMQRRELTSRLNSRFPGTVDVNVRDSRRTLNQHTISDMME